MIPALILLVVAATSAAVQPTLTRKPGWWALDMTTHAGSQPTKAITTHLCTNPQIDKVQSPFAVHMGGGCPAPEIRPDGDGYSVQATCQLPNTRMSVSGILRGDLSSAYRVHLSIQMDPPAAPEANPIIVDIAAHWEGACPAGKAPGDMVMSTSVTPASPSR